MKKVILFIALVSLSSIVVLRVINSPWVTERVRSALVTLARKSTKTDVGIAKVSFGFFPPSVEMSGLSLPPVLTASRVTVTLSPLQLFVGKITIQEIAIDGLRGHLAFSGGKPQLPFPAEKKQGWKDRRRLTLPPIAVTALTIRGADLTLTSDRPSARAHLADLTASVRPDMKSMVFPLSFSIGKAAVTYGARDLPALIIRGEGTSRRDGFDWKKLSVESPEGAITASGSVSGFHRPSLHILLTGRCTLEKVADRLAAWLPKVPPLRGELSWTTTLDGTYPDVRAEGTLALTGGQIAKFVPEDVDVSFAADRKTVEFSRVTARNAGGIITATGSIDLTGDMKTRAAVTVKGISFARLLHNLTVQGSRVEGLVSATAALTGHLRGEDGFFLDGDAVARVDNFRVTKENYLVTEGNWDILRVPHSAVSTRVAIDRQMVRLTATHVSAGTSVITADTELRYHNYFSISFAADPMDVTSLSPIARVPMGGTGTVTGTISGPYNNPLIIAQVNLAGTGLLGWDLGSTQGTIRYQHLLLSFQDMNGTRGGSRYLCAGSLAFGGTPVLSLTASVPPGRIEDIAGIWTRGWEKTLQIKGTVQGTVSLEGPVTALSGGGKITLTTAGILGEMFSSASASGRLDQGSLVVDELSLRKASGSLTLRGSLAHDGALSVSLASRKLILNEINALRRFHYPAEGTVDLNIDMAGTFRNPTAEGTVALRHVKIADEDTGDSDLRLGLRNGLLNIQGEAMGTEITLTSSINLWEGGSYTSTVEMSLMQLTPVFLAFYPKGTRLGGEVSGTMELHGSLWGPHRSQGGFINLSTLGVREGQTAGEGFAFLNDGPIRVLWDNGTWAFKALAMKERGGEEGEFSLRGTIGENTVNVTAEGSLDLQPLALFFPSVIQVSEGTSEFSISATGPRASPVLDGSVSLWDGSILFIGLPVRVTGIDLEASLAGNTLSIDRSEAHVGTGEIAGSGTMTFSGFLPSAYDFSATLKESDIVFARGISALLGGTLTFKGPASFPTLSGEITVEEARLTRWIEWQSLVLEGLLKKYRGRASIAEEGGVRLAVRLAADKGLNVKNNLAQAQLKGRGAIVGTIRFPSFIGILEFLNGSINYLDNRFSISSGTITFSDDKELVPVVDVVAVAVKRHVRDMRGARGDVGVLKDYKIVMHASGRPDDLKISLTSEPSDISEPEIYAVLAAGVIGSEEMGGEAIGMATVMESIRVLTTQVVEKIGSEAIGEEGTEKVGGFFRKVAVDTIQISPSSEAGTASTRITVGKSWSDNWEGSLSTDVGGRGGGRAELRYTLDKNISLLGNWDNDSAILMGDPDPMGNLGGDVVFTIKFR